jgi:hypothetical protein
MYGACRWRCCVAHAAIVFRRMFSNFGIVAQMYSISASVVGCQRWLSHRVLQGATNDDGYWGEPVCRGI